MRTKTPINGITTTSTYTDGDCNSITNLRKKNGLLKAVIPKKIITTFPNIYNPIFVHSSNNYEHYIGVRDSILYYFANGINGSINAIEEQNIMNVSGNVTITQVGNILNILDNIALKNCIWSIDKYYDITVAFDVDEFSTQLFGKINLKVDGSTTGIVSTNNTEMTSSINVRAYRSTDQVYYDTNAHANLQAWRDFRANIFNGLHVKAMSGLKKDGLLHGFFMACTAIELYDGSYIKHSNPIIFNQAFDKCTRYKINDKDYITNKGIFTFNTIQDDGSINSSGSLGYDCNSDGYKNIHLASNYSYVDNIEQLSIPNILGHYFKVEDHNEVPGQYLWLLASYNELKFNIPSLLDKRFKSLIKSVSVFITQEITMYKISDKDKYSFVGIKNTYNNGSNYHQFYESYLPPIKTNEEILKEIEELTNFYKVYEIPFDDLINPEKVGANKWITIDLKDKLGENLLTRDVLPVDNFTHHTLKPIIQYVYNSRLHLQNYRVEFSKGFPMDDLCVIQGIGQFNSINGMPFCIRYWVSVKIQLDNGIIEVVRYSYTKTEYPYFDPNKIMPLLSYPDSRAFEMVICSIGTSGKMSKITVKLKPSLNHNFAYYISPDLKPIEQNYSEIPQSPPTNQNSYQVFENNIKVSKLNNPFSFPLLNTYTIGNGKGINMAANSQKVSEGQFGQYPLYPFTDNGIYSMQVGSGDIVYSNISPISFETPISNILCETPHGIFFLGKRGLYVITGNQVEFVSPQLEQRILDLTMRFPTGADVEKFNKTIPELSNIIKDIIYDASQNELIIVLSQGKNIVWNIDCKEFYLSTEKIDNVVKNIYPNLLVADSYTIKDMQQNNTIAVADCSFITRPIVYGSDNIKRMMRLKLKGLFLNPDPKILILYTSNDKVNFLAHKGIVSPGNRMDIDLGLLPRLKEKSFVLVFKCRMNETDEINYIETEIDNEYNNEKMR